jgi:effector-binding domain-containing protein
MPDTEPHVVTLEPVTAAVVRETVPMGELTAYFDRAFRTVMEVAAAQGVAATGPPFAAYHGMPGQSVDVSGGFPTAAAITPTRGVAMMTLPGGQAVQLLHAGSYDSLEESYGRLMTWMEHRGLARAPLMWETYLTEPQPDGDPSENRTLITWPVAEVSTTSP